MSSSRQKLVPGIVGISTYVDFAYQKEMQLAAIGEPGPWEPINQLKSVTVTLDFKQLIENVRAGRLAAAEAQVAETAQALQAGGAGFIVVTSGTTSTLTGRARELVPLPFLDLAEAAWVEAAAGKPAAIGLLSTRQTVTGGIFAAAAERHKGKLITPRPETAERMDDMIFGELICGAVSDDCVALLGEAAAELVSRGADSIILGNTDMTLAAERLQAVVSVPLIDSARAHARAAARAALSGRV